MAHRPIEQLTDLEALFEVLRQRAKAFCTSLSGVISGGAPIEYFY